MYEEFYEFREKPFSISPDPAFLFLTKKHRRALTLLEYGLENELGFTVITGEIGSGKTTLIRALLDQLDENINVGLVTNTQCDSFEELLRWILFGFELEYRRQDKVELYDTFSEFLLSEYAANRRVVLIIDEAQNLTVESLEQLRMLSNINATKDQLLQMILAGQPGLRATLQKPELQQFAQRIGLDYHLLPLDLAETRGYILHRLIVAGGSPRIFADDTFELIWKSTQGVPRLINVLCDTALVYGFAEQQRVIDAELMTDVINDRQEGLSPIRDQAPSGSSGKRKRKSRDKNSEDDEVQNESSNIEPLPQKR